MDISSNLKNHSHEQQLFARRVLAIVVLILILLSGLTVRYYNLQVTHYQDYLTQSDRNRILVQPIAPSRGLIYDSNGILLASHKTSYTLSIVKERTRDLSASIARLQTLLTISEQDIKGFYKRLKRRRRPYEAVPLRFDLDEKEVAIVAVNEHRLGGVEVVAQPTRYYEYKDLLAHTVGYIGSISERDYSRFDKEQMRRYVGTTVIGKSGLEKQYEDILLGEVGYRHVEINAHGRLLRVLEQTDPLPGKNLMLNLDVNLQQEAVAALDGRRGAVVALDAKSGGVLALVSNPSYDPNLFVRGTSSKDYRALTHSSDRPLFNRVLQGQYPPGSTVKPMFGIGALKNGAINTEFSIRDPGYFKLEGVKHVYRDYKSRSHGQHVDLEQAITQSCNTFFYQLAHKVGIDRMHELGSEFNLGKRTGIDLPNERRGLWPSRAWKRSQLGQPWYQGDSLNVGIGQGAALLTPMQMAVMAYTLANKGRQIPPRLLKAIDGEPEPIQERQAFTAEERDWQYVLNAMQAVVHGARGTARRISPGAKFHMAGKTGTAQAVGIAQGEKYDSAKLSEKQRDHALFIGFAPVESPQIITAVIVENGEHSADAAVVSRKIFDAYLDGKLPVAETKLLSKAR